MDCSLQSSSNLNFVISKIMTLQLENLGNFYKKTNCKWEYKIYKWCRKDNNNKKK